MIRYKGVGDGDGDGIVIKQKGIQVIYISVILLYSIRLFYIERVLTGL